MSPIPVIISGLPGKTARTVTSHLLEDNRLILLPVALTGAEINETQITISGRTFNLLRPNEREAHLKELRQAQAKLIIVDFTHPSAVNANASFFCQLHLPFVMGTTGGDRQQLEETVQSSSIAAVIAPNMAQPIVGLQAMLDYGARNFPALFQGYRLAIKESHQQGKADTSGTAKALLACFQQMGVDCHIDEIVKVRDPEVQVREWGVPREHLAGHGWHTYTLTSPDNTVCLEFRHNINGRDVYAHGTRDAIVFLSEQIDNGIRGRVFNMLDVLQAGAKRI